MGSNCFTPQPPCEPPISELRHSLPPTLLVTFGAWQPQCFVLLPGSPLPASPPPSRQPGCCLPGSRCQADSSCHHPEAASRSNSSSLGTCPPLAIPQPQGQQGNTHPWAHGLGRGGQGSGPSHYKSGNGGWRGHWLTVKSSHQGADGQKSGEGSSLCRSLATRCKAPHDAHIQSQKLGRQRQDDQKFEANLSNLATSQDPVPK